MQSQPEETRETSFHVTHEKGRTRRARSGGSSGKGQDRRNEEEEEHQGRTRREGARIKTSKNSRVGFVACFSLARFSFFPSRFATPSTPRPVNYSRSNCLCFCVQPASSSRTHITAYHRTHQHITLLSLCLYPVVPSLYMHHKPGTRHREHARNEKEENTQHCRPIYPYTCTNTYTINRTPSLVRNPRH